MKKGNLIFPTTIKIAAKSISLDMLSGHEEEINELKREIRQKNRQSKLDSLLNGKEYVERKLENDPKYIEYMKDCVKPLSNPCGELFYIDYKYNDEK